MVFNKLFKSEKNIEIELVSTAFENEEFIPARYTCDGYDISPPLIWSRIPSRTRTLALIMEEITTSENKVHWLIYDLSSTLNGLHEGIPPEQILREDTSQGVNDFGKIGYTGPCPDDNKVHEYKFTLYALDAEIALDEDRANRDVFLRMSKNHIIAQGSLIGKYQKK